MWRNTQFVLRKLGGRRTLRRNGLLLHAGRSVKLGIIGAGSLGTALGGRLATAGHAIMFGGGASAQDAAARQGAQAGSNAETVAFSDVVVLAVPFSAIDVALADAGPLDGRVLTRGR